MSARHGVSVLLVWALAACSLGAAEAAPVGEMPALTGAVVEARTDVAQAAAPALRAAQSSTTAVVVPVVVALQEAVQKVVPPAGGTDAWPALSPAAVALIVRWEVGSQSLYTRRYQSPIWPGGASGVTWGIGYDGGHQTRQQIWLDWTAMPSAERLQGTAGITGQPAQLVARRLGDVRVPFGLASDVFAAASLPRYYASARRAFGVGGFDALPADAQGALVSLVYNRGASMTGPARAEMRAIRDVCLPGSDLRCIAGEIRQMCRLWRGTNLEAGLCGRREDEAGLAERAR